MTDLALDLVLARSMAEQADAISLDRFLATDLKVSTKPDLTPVTEADQAVERALRARLADERPDDGVIGEEFGGDGALTPGRRWIVDPIDGTKNFVRGVPVWATLIALAEDDEVVLGFVSAPAMGRTWWATRGGGAFTREVNGAVRQLSVSRVSRSEDASFAYSDPVGWDRYGERGVAAFDTLLRGTWRSRGYGDFLSHVLVAEGAVDIAAEPTLEPWDVAALVPIVSEAGGRMTGYDGGNCLRSRAGLTTNGLLHDWALSLFN